MVSVKSFKRVGLSFVIIRLIAQREFTEGLVSLFFSSLYKFLFACAMDVLYTIWYGWLKWRVGSKHDGIKNNIHMLLQYFYPLLGGPVFSTVMSDWSRLMSNGPFAKLKLNSFRKNILYLLKQLLHLKYKLAVFRLIMKTDWRWWWNHAKQTSVNSSCGDAAQKNHNNLWKRPLHRPFFYAYFWSVLWWSSRNLHFLDSLCWQQLTSFTKNHKM